MLELSLLEMQGLVFLPPAFATSLSSAASQCCLFPVGGRGNVGKSQAEVHRKDWGWQSSVKIGCQWAIAAGFPIYLSSRIEFLWQGVFLP